MYDLEAQESPGALIKKTREEKKGKDMTTIVYPHRSVHGKK
jgi:hypothetical protein